MKKKNSFLLLLCLTVTAVLPAHAQKKDSTWVGALQGIIWDSAHTAVLRSATVAIYLAKDTQLIAYRLTNNYGEFSVKGLPVNVQLELAASYVGYKTTRKKLVIPHAKHELDIGRINVSPGGKDLEEVIVKALPPPVRVKGDTLEFNADAFKLDPNAQTEDLLRVLPGVVVWADGTITVYGRQVKSVLVNGKPFFGNDARVATQNIPKNTVDKIQVYQKEKDPQKPTDSTSEINIKLKKGKDFGYFGKLSAGLGTQNRYEGDGSLNLFNRRSQLGVVFSANNVNKVANDIEVILRNSTFKGAGASQEYQSDFTIEGLNKFVAGGLLFQHDFIDNPDHYNNNRLNARYFTSNNRQELVQNTQSITSLTDSTFFVNNTRNQSINTRNGHNAFAGYDKTRNGHTLSVEGGFSEETYKGESAYSSVLLDHFGNQLSENAVTEQNKNITSRYSFKSAFRESIAANSNRWYSLYDLSYKFSLTEVGDEQAYRSDFVVTGNPLAGRNIDRIYDNQSLKMQHSLVTRLPNFGRIIGGRKTLAGFSTGLQNELHITTDTKENEVGDKLPGNGHYVLNPDLTNDSRELTIDVKPALTFRKLYSNTLANRYAKYLTLNIAIAEQFWHLNSNSPKAFQQFSKQYQNFAPAISLDFSNRQYGEFTNNGYIKINTTYQYPGVQQLAPLVDSANQNFIQTGNPLLKEQRSTDLTINFSHLSERLKNILSYSFRLSAGYADDYMAGSSYIDALGRTAYTVANANGYRYITVTSEIRKAWKINSSQIQFLLSSSVSMHRNPNYINGVLNYYNNFSLYADPAVNYTFQDRFDLKFIQKVNYNRYKQKMENGVDLSNMVGQSQLSASWNCTKKITLNNSVSWNNNRYNGASVKSFTIWNASAACRFFKDNTGEIRLSCLDILHQNTGLINYGLNNTITHGTGNILQQYFMLTMAWFPKKFGK